MEYDNLACQNYMSLIKICNSGEILSNDIIK